MADLFHFSNGPNMIEQGQKVYDSLVVGVDTYNNNKIVPTTISRLIQTIDVKSIHHRITIEI